MPRLAAAVVAFSLATLAPAAPAPKDGPKEAALYFPAKRGSRWVYRTPSRTIVHVISSVEAKGDATVIAIDAEEGGKATPVEKLSLSDKGVFRVEALGEKVDPPLCLLKLPHTRGQKWETRNAPDEPIQVGGKHEAFGPEEVAVRAGKYRAIRVISEYTVAGLGILEAKATPQTDWYAPGVGRVKWMLGDAVTELAEFTPGKE